MATWLRKQRARVMTPEEAAWLAGFFDGEGSLYYYMAGKGRKYKTWSLAVYNTHEDSLRYCVRIAGCGSIIVKTRVNRCKKQWVWRVNGKRDVDAIVRQMLPYLQVKRAVAIQALRELSESLSAAA